MRKHLSLLFTAYLLGMVLYSFVKFNELKSDKELYLSGLLGVLIIYAVVYCNAFLNRVIPFKKLLGLRILIGIIWTWILSFLISFLGYKVFSNLQGFVLRSDERMDIFTKLGILLFCAALLYNIIYFALYSYDNYARGQVLEVQLERKQAKLQLMTLKAQLSPHFLFNSMNSLSSLFQKDSEKAETFIRALGKSYQFILDNYKSNLVQITEELSFVKAYLFLIKTRFGDGVVVKLALDNSMLNSKVPPLTLQLLIENAIKHNTFDEINPLEIQVFSDGDFITISNTKTKRKEQLASTKVGLKNIISRYELLSEKKVEIKNDEKEFIVKIPVVR